jgi:hypothetical protein
VQEITKGVNIMKSNIIKYCAGIALFGLSGVSVFAQVTNVASMGDSLVNTAGEVNNAVGLVILAALAIFALVWGVVKLKSAISSGA